MSRGGGPTAVLARLRGSRRHVLGWLSASIRLAAAAMVAAIAHAASPIGVPVAGPARVVVTAHDIRVANQALSADWPIGAGRIKAGTIRDLVNGQTLRLEGPFFWLDLADGRSISSDDCVLAVPPRTRRLKPANHASRLAERDPGLEVVTSLRDAEGRFAVRWRVTLRDGSHYVRQELTLHALRHELPIRHVRVIDVPARRAQVAGTVKGSPLVSGQLILGCEHPLSTCAVDADRARCGLDRALPLLPGAPFSLTTVVCVTELGQLRRGFLRYLERERARPYKPILHYNSWYDLGYFSKFDEAGALDVIAAYGEELVRKRGVILDSFLFDDGWDDPNTLWRFHRGFPSGFLPLRRAAAQYGAAPGVWLSPWGGYGAPKAERVKHGKAAGFETDEQGFVLSGPTYYERFRAVCLDMIRRYGVNQLKIDGTGHADRVSPGSRFGSDFEAAIALISELRAAKPDLYVNLTTGTYPSPFWLLVADSIWRGGEDHDFGGAGSNRQRWITYRDADTYAGVVNKGPLFPLNSVMLHGLIYARHAKGLDSDPGNDFASEVRSYFATGTQLQEMYVTPGLLTPGNWDVLAESARWARGNADVLADSHWVGGDPGRAEVYGWASWSPRKAILALRNPSDRRQAITLDIGRALELPAEAVRQLTARSPWRADAAEAAVELEAGKPHTFELAPFEVTVLELMPTTFR